MTMPLVLFLSVIVFLLVRSRELRVWQLVLVGLWGFYMARTHWADPIVGAVTWFVAGLFHT